MKTFIILTFLNFSCLLLCEEITEIRCVDRNNKNTQFLTLKCPPNLFINVKDALYGRNDWDICKFFVGDCTEVFNIDTQCCGRNDCTLVIRRIYSTKCLAYVSFFRVVYECQTAQQSTCSVKDNHITHEIDNNSETSDVWPPTPPDVVKHTSDAEGVPTDVYIIIGSAATVAFLMAAIVTAIFFLRKYQWQGEKQCILELFVGLCKRHPPDGCENPTDVTICTESDRSASNIQQVTTISTLVKADALHENINKTVHFADSPRILKHNSSIDISKEVTLGQTMVKPSEPNILSSRSEQKTDNAIYCEIISTTLGKANTKDKTSTKSQPQSQHSQDISPSNQTDIGIFTDV